MGGSISNPVGSMFCIWSDVPGAEAETEVAKYVRPILRAMSAAMDGDSTYEVTSVVSGGFNADGTLNAAADEGSGDGGNTGEKVIELLVGQTYTELVSGVDLTSQTYTPAPATSARHCAMPKPVRLPKCPLICVTGPGPIWP